MKILEEEEVIKNNGYILLLCNFYILFYKDK